jgi:pseudaminic acid cytidylyltransferase
MTTIAIIPARGGSKRIPRKNIREFCGKPMIAYAIEAAQSSNLFDRIIVSTDDSEIARVSESYDAEVPFKRPEELANDYAGTVEVIAHAIGECIKNGVSPEKVCCIYPCVPLIKSEDIVNAMNLLESNANATYSFPVTEFPSAIQRGLRRDSKGNMSSFYPENEKMRTQDLEPAYYDVGQFYWGYRDSWLKNHALHNNGLGYIIPSWRVVDIDLLDDWARAELFFRFLASKESE